jgi:hypothetical protein
MGWAVNIIANTYHEINRNRRIISNGKFVQETPQEYIKRTNAVTFNSKDDFNKYLYLKYQINLDI